VVNGPVDPAAETRRTEVPDGVPGANGAAPPPAGPDSAPPGRGRGPLVVAALALAVAIVASAAFFATRPTPTASVAPSPTPSEIAVTTPSPSRVESPTPSPTPTATPEPSPTPPPTSGYLADRADLVARAALAQQGVQPYKAAVDDLMAWAKGARGSKPHPVRSLRIDGTEGPFVDDTATAYGLALAYVVSGDEQYAQASARFIDAWVDTMTSTRLTCANDGACQTSLIIGRTAPGFVFAADLLSESPSFDAAAQARLKRWLHDLILPTASRLTNNWGDTGTFTRVAITAYLGDVAGFESAVAKWRRLMDLIPSDGHIPAEVARGRAGMSYTQEALDYKVATAVIAERHGTDLWSYAGAKGGTLKKAVDYLARYMRDKRGWPWSSRVRRRPASDMWELAYAHWQDPDYRRFVTERRPYGVLGHSAVRWTTLTNGIPLVP
jgi:Alginate lyase